MGTKFERLSDVNERIDGSILWSPIPTMVCGGLYCLGTTFSLGSRRGVRSPVTSPSTGRRSGDGTGVSIMAKVKPSGRINVAGIPTVLDCWASTVPIPEMENNAVWWILEMRTWASSSRQSKTSDLGKVGRSESAATIFLHEASITTTLGAGGSDLSRRPIWSLFSRRTEISCLPSR